MDLTKFLGQDTQEPSAQRLSKEEYAAQKKQEREEIWGMIDGKAQEIFQNGDSLKGFLDFMGQCKPQRTDNLFLLYAQNPEIRQIKTFEKWKEEGKVVKTGSKGYNFIVGQEYEKDGVIQQGYSIQKAYDISQIRTKQPEEAEPKPMDQLMEALLTDSEVRIQIADNLPDKVQAQYIPNQRTIYVRNGMSENTTFHSISRELAYASLDHHDGSYSRAGVAAQAYCAAYVTAQKYGVDVSGFSFDKVCEMQAFGQKDPKEQVKEEDEDYESPLDILFDRLEMRDPDSIAVKQYHIYKQAAGKTAKSILISVGVRLAAFNLPQIAKLTNTDELDLSSMGERKVALFCCIPDADTSLNYLVGMIYSQLFQTLYYMADRVHGGALPVPVNCIMDEFPNVSLPNEFEKILATCRSRSIYCSIIIQNMSQLKALFKDSWESLVGNCDEFLYLGGNEKETHKYVSELLGKETIDTNTYGQTKGKSGSYSTNFQQSGRELLQPDEVRMLDNQNALLFIRGERPILDAKYDLMKHPNIRYTEDGGAGPFNYAKAPLAHDDFTFDETRYNDYELLLDEDIIGELF